MKHRIVIIGGGAIALHLGTRLDNRGHDVRYFTRITREQMSFHDLIDLVRPHAVFLAISTTDKGEAALEYILTCMKMGIPVIICEKGSLAYHAQVLRPHMSHIGFSASLGGGTRLLNYVASHYPNEKKMNIQVVLNSTLNFIFDELRHGSFLVQACAAATKTGSPEPGASDALSLINGELRDVHMKPCVFFNTVLAREQLITPDMFGRLELTKDDLRILNEKGGDYRMVVSFSNHPSTKVLPYFGKHFGIFCDGWHIEGGFRQITKSSGLESWLPEGIGNAVHIAEGELGAQSIYTLSGPGAGLEPTTTAMLTDFRELCT